jgi:hypothetical protein
MNPAAVMALVGRRIALRPGATALLALSVFALSFVAGSVFLLQQGIEQTARHVIAAGPSLVVSRVDAGGWAPLPATEAQRIARIRGVSQATARVWGVLPGPPSVTLMGSTLLDDGSSEAIAGTGPAAAANDGILSLRGLDGSITTFRVQKVLDRTSDVATQDLVLVSVAAARRLLLLHEGDATDVAVRAVHPQEEEALAREIPAGAPWPLRVVTRKQLDGAYMAQLGQRMGLTTMTLVPSILALALLVAGIAAGGDKARREVGKLKLLGWSTGQVAMLHVLEVAVPAGAGAFAGLALGYAQLFVFGGGNLTAAVLGWGDIAPHFWLDSTGAALAMVQIAALVLAPCGVAAAVPSWRLAHADPVQLIEAP